MYRRKGKMLRPVLIAAGIAMGIGLSFSNPKFVTADESKSIYLEGSHKISWFPKIACADAWEELRAKGNLQKYQYGKDMSYKTYQERIGKVLPREDCYKTWTILVFMAADNSDLSPYALWDLSEMEANMGGMAASTDRADLLVQVDTLKTDGIFRFHMFETENEFDPSLGHEHFSNQTVFDVHSPVVAEFDENLPQKDALYRFLQWGMRSYPAEHYMVVLWGHGQTWKPKFDVEPIDNAHQIDEEAALDPPQDVPHFIKLEDLPTYNSKSDPNGRTGAAGLDETQGSYLQISDISDILGDVTQDVFREKAKANLMGDEVAEVIDFVSNDLFEGEKLIDVYVQDSCLLQSVEVITELADNVEFVIGSAQIQSYLGLPYRLLMRAVNSGDFAHVRESEDEAYRMARMIPKVYEQSIIPGHGEENYQGRMDPGSQSSMTLSSVSAGILKYQLVHEIHKLAAELHDYASQDYFRASDLKLIIQSVPSFRGGTQDLNFFMGYILYQLEQEEEITGVVDKTMIAVRKQIGKVQRNLNEAVLANVRGSDYWKSEDSLGVLNFKSLSIWLPKNDAEYKALIKFHAGGAFYNYQSGNPRYSGAWLRFLELIYNPGN